MNTRQKTHQGGNMKFRATIESTSRSYEVEFDLDFSKAGSGLLDLSFDGPIQKEMDAERN